MSEWRENIERVREALADYYRLGDVFPPPGLAVLDALTAQMEELERGKVEAAEYLSGILDTTELWQVRAEAAEQRVEELEAALRRIASKRIAYGGPENDWWLIARAALAQSDPPED